MSISGAIINVVSFDKEKQAAINTILNDGLWGFSESTKNSNCWKLLTKKIPVLLYGDSGIFVASYIKSKFQDNKVIPFWNKSNCFPLRIRLELLNKKIENVVPISRDELIKHGISLAKTGFMGYSLVLFGENTKKKGVSYDSKKFIKIWDDFLKRNNKLFSEFKEK